MTQFELINPKLLQTLTFCELIWLHYEIAHKAFLISHLKYRDKTLVLKHYEIS